MIYGTPIVKIEQDLTDRIGIRTLMLSQMWQASRGDMSIDELDGESPATPTTPSGMEFIGRETRMQGGALRTYWTYTGVHGSVKDVQFKTRGNSPDYRFEPGFAQVNIALHPNITKLLDAYNGFADNGEIIWQPTIGGGSAVGSGILATGTGTIGLGGTGDGSSKKNPMFGVQDFMRLEGTYTYRYAAVDINGLTDGVDGIFQAGGLPGTAPGFPGRDYLKAPLGFQRHGPVFSVTETYWLSGAGGWPRPVYDGSIK